MARLTIAAAFGVLVGLVAGAALGIRAEPDEVLAAANEAGVDPTDLQGAVNSTGLAPRSYLVAVGELRAEPVPRPPAASRPVGIWDTLAQCESRGNWAANTGNGFFGGLQFLPSTWRANGGTGMPHQASRAEQIRVAEIVQARYGWGQWPACSRLLGLR